MNPIIILVVALVLINGNGSSESGHSGSSPIKPFNMKIPPIAPPMPPYFDTFKMELLLDKLRLLINSLEKINKVNQMSGTSESADGKSVTIDKIHESLDAIKDLLADQKTGQHLNTISGALSGIKQFGDVENMMATLGPILSMLSAGGNEKE